MAITNTTNEVGDGTRKTRAQGSIVAGDQSAKASRNRSRDSEGSTAPRATPRSLSDRETASRSRRENATPIVELTIDLDDDRVLDAVAQFLLDLVDRGVEAKP
jgi:hypothetical protein